MIKKIIKSISFLRYLFIIFISSVIIFLITPKFFDYSKKDLFIKKTLKDNYGINLQSYSDISYDILPFPQLEISKVSLNFKNNIANTKVENLSLILNLKHIYQFNNLNVQKILLDKAIYSIDTNNVKIFLKNINGLNNRFKTLNSTIVIKDNNREVVRIQDISLNNSGNSLFLKGKIFNKKFIGRFSKNKLNFDVPSIGSKNTIFFKKDSTYDEPKGRVKLQLLNNNLNFNFNFNEKKELQIFDSFFMNNFIKTSIDGTLKTSPYFNFDIASNIKKLYFKKIINNNDVLDKVDNFSKVSKKLNGRYKIFYKPQKLNSKFIQEANISLFFENGDVTFKDNIFNFNEGKAKLNGNFSDLNGYQIIKFNLSGNLNDAKKFFKKFKINFKDKNKDLNFYISGSLNISAKKINFSEIIINKNNLTEEDLKYYKIVFENFISDKLSNLINLRKIREAVAEIN